MRFGDTIHLTLTADVILELCNEREDAHHQLASSAASLREAGLRHFGKPEVDNAFPPFLAFQKSPNLAFLIVYLLERGAALSQLQLLERRNPQRRVSPTDGARVAS